MKELLIKIRALFEGNGADQAASSLNKVSDAADKAKSSTGNLSGGLGDGAAKAGIFGGAMAAVTTAVIGFAEQALSAAINAIKNLIAGFAEGILKVGQLADALEELSARTGVSTGDLLVLRKAFEDAGIGADAVGPMMNRLQKALAGVNEEGQPTSEALAKLGLSVSSLSTMSGVQQIAAVQDAIMKLPTPAAQAAAAMEIFGRAGGQMLALFKDSGALDAAREKLGSLVDNMVKAGPAMAKFGEAFSGENIDTKKMQFFAAAAAQFASELEKAGVALNKLDLGPLGEEVGLVVRGAIEVTKEISAWVHWFKQFSDAIGLTGPLMEGLGAAIRNALDPLNISGFLGYLRQTGEESVKLEAQQKAVAEANNTIANSAQIAADTIARIRSEAQGVDAQAAQAGQNAITNTATSGTETIRSTGSSAQDGIATAGKTAAQEIQLSSDQLKAATQQITAAMSEANTTGVTPAMNALVESVQESFARITGELTSALATMQSAQAEQVPAFTEAVAQLTATMAASTEATTAATATIAQSVTASAEKTVAATQQSAQAINQAFGQISQAIVQSNQAMANGLSSLASSVSSSLANLQQQINAVAARIR